MDIETREQALARYAALRAIGSDQYNRAMGLVSKAALLAQAKKLGLAAGETIVADERAFDRLCDLALYTAAPGRRRAVERYAQASKAPAGSDERFVMEAKLAARFSLWRIDRKHPLAGLILLDIVRNEEVWLMDNGLEASASMGACFAARVYTPGPFSMTCGVTVAMDVDTLRDVLATCMSLERRSAEAVVNHRKFATSLYRLDISEGMEVEIDWAA